MRFSVFLIMLSSISHSILGKCHTEQRVVIIAQRVPSVVPSKECILEETLTWINNHCLSSWL